MFRFLCAPAAPLLLRWLVVLLVLLGGATGLGGLAHADEGLKKNPLPLAKALDQPIFSLDGTHVELFSLLLLFLGTLVVMSVRKRRQLVRHLVQVSALLVFFYVVFSCLGVFGLIRNTFHGISLIGTVQTESFFWMSLPVCVLAFTLITGPFFCGWICPTGTIQELLALLREALTRRPRLPVDPRTALLVAPLATAFLYLVFSVSEERKLFVEDSSLYWAAASLFLPLLVMTRVATDSAARSLRWLSLGAILFSVVFKVGITSPMHFAFMDIVDPASAITTLVLAGASLVVARAWCRYLCPWGMVMGLVHRFSRQRIEVDPASCTQCRRCVDACRVEAVTIVPGRPELGKVALDQCQFCYACVDACQRGAMQVTDTWCPAAPLSVEKR
ncbi:MAG: 4Fe-4S binding protein [Deltaproteobacteria bacterium]|nr:4Fe-4S binding protein [Deltaproteobacteria bacterium]